VKCSKKSNSALDTLAEEYGLDQDSHIVIKKFLKLKPELRSGAIAYLKELAKVFQNAPAAPVDEEFDSIGTDIDTVSAEAAYAKTLHSAQRTESSALNITDGIEKNRKLS
jgi:hypothetical protein